MSGISFGSIACALIPVSQRLDTAFLRDRLDLGQGDAAGRRSGFLIMIVLAGVIAVAGGAGRFHSHGERCDDHRTAVDGIALGIVTGHRSLVARLLLWIAVGVAVVVVIGFVLWRIRQACGRTLRSSGGPRRSYRICSQRSRPERRVRSRCAAGTFRRYSRGSPSQSRSCRSWGSRRVCIGQGAWEAGIGALVLFLSNVVSLVIAGSIIFTIAGYAREAEEPARSGRRRASRYRSR